MMRNGGGDIASRPDENEAFGQAFLGMIAEWFVNNAQPEHLFPPEALAAWAHRNGYVKIQAPDAKTVRDEFASLNRLLVDVYARQDSAEQMASMAGYLQGLYKIGEAIGVQLLILAPGGNFSEAEMHERTKTFGQYAREAWAAWLWRNGIPELYGYKAVQPYPHWKVELAQLAGS